MLRFGGVFFDQGTTLSTSGSSLGLAKKYRWGPNFAEAHNFHEHLCFGDLSYDLSFNVFVDTRLEHAFNIAPAEMGWIGKHYTCYTTPSAANAGKIHDFIARHSSAAHVVVKLLPSQAEILIRRGSDFLSRLFHERYCFHVTGEVCGDVVKRYFRDSGVPLRDTMKVWNSGAGFYTCPHGSLHWDDMTAVHEVTPAGELVATDLFNLSQPFHRIPTGDRLRIVTGPDRCPCGLHPQTNVWEERACTVNVGGKLYDWYRVHGAFLKAYMDATGVAGFDAARDEVLGLSFGMSETLAAVHYETLRDIDQGAAAVIESSLSKTWGVPVMLIRGLKSNNFKTKRMFVLSKNELESLLKLKNRLSTSN